MTDLHELFGFKPEGGNMLGRNIRLVLYGVLAGVCWLTALVMGWLAVAGVVSFHWAAFAGAEILTILGALSFQGQLMNLDP